MSQPVSYRFSFGPWNIHEGADPFGPETRPGTPHEAKFALYRPLGFEGVQFHDDDVVPEIDGKTPAQLMARTAEVKRMLDNQGLVPEFVAPRLWFAPQTVDGGYTSNCAADRQYALDRTRRAVDIARALGTKGLVLWLAREGSYIRESKNARVAYERLLGTVNAILDHDPEIEVWIEPKPNEPTTLAYASKDPKRVKGLIETAHALLAGLDPSDEMAFALAHGKLASVHLNDQNGLKYDQDKNFGTANLRVAFNQVRVLEEAGYGRNGEFIGLDVKAPVTAHLKNSRELFLALVQKVRTYDRKVEQECIESRDYEALELHVLKHLMGI
jgi:xylose isomerase